MAVHGVLFDLGNTLVSYYQAEDFHPILKKCIRRCCQSLAGTGVIFDEDVLFARAKRLNREREDLSVYPLAERLQVLFGREINLNRQQIGSLVDTFMGPIFSVARIDDAAIPLLQALRGRGIKTGILSNTPWGSPSRLWRAELRRHHLADNIDLALFCVDVGWRKPAPQLFNTALERLGLESQHTIYVGDDPRWDIAGARNAGLTPLLLAKEAPDPNQDAVTVRSLDAILPLVTGSNADSLIDNIKL